MHLHILGICGTFMGGIARLAVEKGFKVTGSDRNCYPPMSDQLERLGISLHEGYDAEQLASEPDCVVVGNAMTRGMPVIESLLESTQVYRSGPQWLNENILQDKWVIAAAGTHGKTTTASMIAWILEANGYNPGFLIGGVMENFGVSARLTESPFFVVEADEYDTAFFDKRSKFIHYRARTIIVNNLEFDHADIFDSLSDIEKQFSHVIRTIPKNGLIVKPNNSTAIERVLDKGIWTPVESFGLTGRTDSDWFARKVSEDGSQVEVYFKGQLQGTLNWQLIGDHNVSNALAAISACRHVGVTPESAIAALAGFKNVKRRMELKGEVNGIAVYDDFAHHPTAIETTVSGLRSKVGKNRILATVDLRSNTMKRGVHKDTLIDSVKQTDYCIFHTPDGIDWNFNFDKNTDRITALNSPETIGERLVKEAKPGDSILVMSNGGFGGIHDKILDGLKSKRV
ncbi:UDP-N-acetylmuramate:L-alanyl-gamma-D-glutamyl-meso-diaminopimelate ligase [Aliikangiella marina]|uniref:UDP-N-acetylmuramate--L-alanyl-gamma-D-glutamyl-meso-2,6-diaminoheptandioate ligase n=1 Tax=Aliikangiella marina TaxID=1712262 RepID=A0A545TH66_9GAMM|nr:UDP-N-acetylmuramate:L-alanyl-gamma-D-glutamyl-meso-diaminopimelate ligase [Aliikangiella marina]TQV76538.1 UDP-N-acetylmuramate:L-alanyl-gamma-D-glutamyl-meso-diaminopimelate ligase [Aliikangiella marina]